MKGSVQSSMSGLKAADIPRFLFGGARDCNLDLEILYVDKGWIRETVYFKLSGEEENLRLFQRNVSKIVSEYNQS